ncbi:hypothetical protein NE237_027718 [Protea cynaroides]|uniref:Uncharacterized protein n=1 Tax=Protea cynaroides TaxID=273540 RepID=A0A9Q0GN15_9MAGN|nr:hypothetical protein NE237_027718 [Protea cynaroides]
MLSALSVRRIILLNATASTVLGITVHMAVPQGAAVCHLIVDVIAGLHLIMAGKNYRMQKDPDILLICHGPCGLHVAVVNAFQKLSLLLVCYGLQMQKCYLEEIRGESNAMGPSFFEFEFKKRYVFLLNSAVLAGLWRMCFNSSDLS